MGNPSTKISEKDITSSNRDFLTILKVFYWKVFSISRVDSGGL
jgi:hypothetical protein